MAASTAFAELAEVLRRFEHRDLELHEISVTEESLQDADELTATVTADIPVFNGVAPQDGITIETADGTVVDDGYTVELSVTVSTDASPNSHTRTASDPAVDGPHLAAELVQAANGGVPAYKDPEALQAVYEQYDSFPQMTDALGVDVTSETVRRYMVQYDIHDPDDGEIPTTDDAGAGDHTAGAPEGESAARSDPDAVEDVTGQGSSARQIPADRSVAALLADDETNGTEDRQVADGMGIPPELTVSELFEILESSRTVHGVARKIGVETDYTRRLLSELDLLEYATGRIGDLPTEIPAEERSRLLGSGEGTSVAE